MSLTTLLCILASFVLIVVALVRKPAPKADRAGDLNIRAGKKRNWILPIIIAIVLSFWNMYIAFLYFAIVWILRLDPKEQLSNVVTEDDKKTSATNHQWLRNSAFITIPVFFVALLFDNPPVVAALVPFIFHIPLINRLKTKSLYVYRHTQQSLMLLLLRAASASIIFSIFYLDEGFWPFVLINGSLWLFGTNWEISQVRRNDCWLMRRRGEAIVVPDTHTVKPPSEPPLKEGEFDGLLRSLPDLGHTARQRALNAFRTSTPEIRIKAVRILTELGEVEKF
ncbi:MAG TPA: hypothetical protein VMN99_08505 [Anaerolineales bacterium]|nr:hypothetical protein [Anaerolineales bacterium]